MLTEQAEFDLLATKSGRFVGNRRRAKKLRKRGENIWWNHYFNGWIWPPIPISASQEKD